MKNLQVLKKNRLQLQDQILGFCIDADNGVLYVIEQRLQILKIATQELSPEPKTVAHNLNITPELELIGPDDLRLIEFFVESGSIIIALRTGHLLRIGVSSYSPPSGYFYQHPHGISSIKLSPDQDLIALADVCNGIHIIAPDGEILRTQDALLQNDSLYKPVGVGWGSKETQFFGLDGRPSKERREKEQNELNQDEIDVIDKIESSDKYRKFRSKLERNTVIDWRGDGQYLATLTFIPDNGRHYMKVWNRNLELQYISDQLVTIERDLLTWVPNGHFICCSLRRDRKINEIVMFEKNGLVHQRVVLPFNLRHLFVKDMIWSPNSKILAVVANQFNLDDDRVHFTPILMLYTMQNFHYYLKFTTKLQTDLYYTIRWNPINHNKLHAMSDSGSYSEYVCNFEVNYSEQHSTVAVIDSNKILITPLQKSNIPPPMTALTLEVESPIYSIALNHQKATDMFIFTFEGQLICTNSNLNLNSDHENQFLKINRDLDSPLRVFDDLTECFSQNRALYRIGDVHSYQNFVSICRSKLIAVKMLDIGCEIVHITLSDSIEASVRTIAKLDNRVVAIARNSISNSDHVALVQNDGSVVILDCDNDKFQPLFQFNPNLKLNFIELQSICSQDKTKIALISLFQDMNLSFNDDVVLSTSCTSFRITENYLIYTTTENLMHFLLLHRLWDGLTSETCAQPIEVGATLTIASEADAKVVLQAPRGNLEILHPRVLIFSTLTQLLDQKEFVSAMQLARRHRVNMNFICDYLLRMTDGEMTLLKEFALAVANFKPQLLSLFLTELDNEDTISSRYGILMKHLPIRAVTTSHKIPKLEFGKVQTFCGTMNLPDDLKFLQPKLLSLLKQTPKKTCESLWLVYKLEEQFHRESLEFMLYFIDIDQLFLDSLRTYNTDIALMVANVSHKDPKEYLALLGKFNGIENNLLRAFEIDMHTKHFSDAFEKLMRYHDTQSFQDPDYDSTHSSLWDIAVSKKIFKQALSCFKSTTKDRKLFEKLWSDYGSYLLEKRCYLEAGLAFSKALELNTNEIDHFNKALNCFSLANRSENAFALISKLTNRDKHTESVIVRLLEENKAPEALILFFTNKLRSANDELNISEEVHDRFEKKLTDTNCWYLFDLISSEKYEQAVRDNIASEIKDSVQSQISTWTSELQQMKEQFSRLKELLTTHKSRAIDEHNNMNSKYISDSLSTIDGSDISSTMSGLDGQIPSKSGASSIKTRKSSKSTIQRKKRINLKPGSRYEDLALALELRKYVSRQKSDEDENMRLLAGLFEYCYSTDKPEDDLARRESRRMNDLLVDHFNLRQSILSLLWPDSPMNEQMFSLYLRFNKLLSEEGRTYENEEFEVLMRPNLSKAAARFEL